jgi:hypothetical protein
MKNLVEKFKLRNQESQKINVKLQPIAEAQVTKKFAYSGNSKY